MGVQLYLWQSKHVMQENTEAKNSDDGIKIGLSKSQAFVLTKSVLVQRTAIFALLFYKIFKASFRASEAEEWRFIDKFLLQNIWIPWMCVNSVLFLCQLYYLYALTQTSLRFLYVDVFYINTFVQLVRIFFGIYMIVITLVPHEGIKFNGIYMVIIILYFGYYLIDGLLNLTFVAATYFRIETIKKSLSKYWFIRLIIYLLVDSLLLGYYSYLLLVKPFASGHVVGLVICIVAVICIMSVLKMELCEPKRWQLRSLDENKIPQSEKIKIAVKIMEMKKEV